jgi:hypothetical protein
MRTVPVNHSAGPLPEGREPTRLISIVMLLALFNSHVPMCPEDRPLIRAETDLRDVTKFNQLAVQCSSLKDVQLVEAAEIPFVITTGKPDRATASGSVR